MTSHNYNPKKDFKQNQAQKAITELICKRCIALTGGIATGKSTVAGILRDLGFQVADADQFARTITGEGSPILQVITDHFGSTVLNPDRSLNRDRLRQLVMSDPAKRRELESITHPAIQAEFTSWVAAHIDPSESLPFFYEASLIFETNRELDFWQIWATICPDNIQLARLMSRSKLTRQEANLILKSQMPAEVKASRANIVIDTDCDLSALRERVAKFATPLLKGPCT
jgi:dephospho-CoA kinase